MHYKIKELHRLITNLKNEEGLSDYGVTLLEGYAVGLETVVKNCSIPAVSNQRELLIAYNKHILDKLTEYEGEEINDKMVDDFIGN